MFRRTRPPDVDLNVVTYNAGNASHAHVLADLRRLRAWGAQVILLQEVADRHVVLAGFAAVFGWQLHQELEDDKGHVAVLVAPDIPVIAKGYHRCTHRTPVGAWGAGPATIAGKWIAWVRVLVNGREVELGSTHLVPSVQRPARTAAAAAARARRVALYVAHVAAIAAWFTSRRAKVLGADWNATRGFRALGRLAGLVVRAAPSHGRRAIDMLRSTRRRWLKPGRARALDGYSSDHRPVMVTYRIRARRNRRGGGQR